MPTTMPAARMAIALLPVPFAARASALGASVNGAKVGMSSFRVGARMASICAQKTARLKSSVSEKVAGAKLTPASLGRKSTIRSFCSIRHQGQPGAVGA